MKLLYSYQLYIYIGVVYVLITNYLLRTILAEIVTLAEQGISAEVIDLRSIRPLDMDTIIESVKKTNRLVTAEEGSFSAAARALGATRIIATDVNPLRLRMAATLGADRLVDVSKESYQSMGFKRFGWLGLIPAVLGSAARAMQARVR